MSDSGESLGAERIRTRAEEHPEAQRMHRELPTRDLELHGGLCQWLAIEYAVIACLAKIRNVQGCRVSTVGPPVVFAVFESPCFSMVRRADRKDGVDGESSDTCKVFLEERQGSYLSAYTSSASSSSLSSASCRAFRSCSRFFAAAD